MITTSHVLRCTARGGLLTVNLWMLWFALVADALDLESTWAAIGGLVASLGFGAYTLVRFLHQPTRTGVSWKWTAIVTVSGIIVMALFVGDDVDDLVFMTPFWFGLGLIHGKATLPRKPERLYGAPPTPTDKT